MKRRIISVVLIAVAITTLALAMIFKANEDDTFIKLKETEQELTFEGAGKNLAKKYVELRMTTETAIRGEMDFDEVDELAIAWGELFNATEIFAKMDVTDINVEVGVGNIGESGTRKIVKGIQGAYGWSFPVAKEILKLNEMIMTDAKTIGEQVKLAEKDLGSFEEQMKKIDGMARINVFVTGDGYEEEKENLAAEGILFVSGVDMAVQVGKTNANIILAKDNGGFLISGEEFRGLPAILEESSVLLALHEGQMMMYGAEGLSGLIQVGKIIEMEVKQNENEVEVKFSSKKLTGVSTGKLREQGMELVGKKMTKMNEIKDMEINDFAKKYRVTWIEEKTEEAYARVAGS